MEKWTIRNDSINECLFKTDTINWTCDIVGPNDTYEVVTVWGKTKEQCLSRADRICKVNEMEALIEMIHGRRYQSNFTDTLIEKIEALYNDLNKTK